MIGVEFFERERPAGMSAVDSALWEGAMSARAAAIGRIMSSGADTISLNALESLMRSDSEVAALGYVSRVSATPVVQGILASGFAAVAMAYARDFAGGVNFMGWELPQ